MRKYLILSLAVCLCLYSVSAVDALQPASAYSIPPICDVTSGTTVLSAVQAASTKSFVGFSRYFDPGTNDHIELRYTRPTTTTIFLNGLTNDLADGAGKTITVTATTTVVGLVNSFLIVQDGGLYTGYLYTQSNPTMTPIPLNVPGTGAQTFTTFKPISVGYPTTFNFIFIAYVSYTAATGGETPGFLRWNIDPTSPTTLAATTAGARSITAGSVGTGFPTDILAGGENFVILTTGTAHLSDGSTFTAFTAGDVTTPANFNLKTYSLVGEVTAITICNTDKKTGGKIMHRKGTAAAAVTLALVDAGVADTTHKFESDLVRNVIAWGQKSLVWITVDWAAGFAIISKNYVVLTADTDIIAARWAALAGNRAFLLTANDILIIQNTNSVNINIMRSITFATAGTAKTALALTGAAQFTLKATCTQPGVGRYTCFSRTLNCVITVLNTSVLKLAAVPGAVPTSI